MDHLALPHAPDSPWPGLHLAPASLRVGWSLPVPPWPGLELAHAARLLCASRGRKRSPSGPRIQRKEKEKPRLAALRHPTQVLLRRLAPRVVCSIWRYQADPHLKRIFSSGLTQFNPISNQTLRKLG